MIRRFVFLLLDPFCAVSGLDPPKRGPPQPDLRLASFSCCWTPFRAVSVLDPPKSCNLTSDLLPYPAKRGCPLVPCFWSHVFSSLAARRGCTCVIPTGSFFCSWPFCSLCGSCCSDILLLPIHLLSMAFMQGFSSSVGRAQGPLGLKILPQVRLGSCTNLAAASLAAQRELLLLGFLSFFLSLSLSKVPRNLTSDLLPFPAAGPLFVL